MEFFIYAGAKNIANVNWEEFKKRFRSKTRIPVLGIFITYSAGQRTNEFGHSRYQTLILAAEYGDFSFIQLLNIIIFFGG